MVRCWSLLLLLVPLSWSQSLPDAPSATRVADKQFWSLTAVNGAITLSDVLTTSFLVGKGSACPYEIGSPGLYGLKAPPARVAAVMGSAFAASVATSYFLKKYNVRIWKLKLWTVPHRSTTRNPVSRARFTTCASVADLWHG